MRRAQLLSRSAAALSVVAACGRAHFDRLADGPSSDSAGGMGAIGCADGQRDAFADRTLFPTIAGCGAAWDGAMSLRASRSGAACGDDLGPCTSPADACAIGWHVCMTSGLAADLSSRITTEQCARAGGGTSSQRFVAAAGHCTACTGGCLTESDCSYDVPLACIAAPDMTACTQPVCCGMGCTGMNVCRTGVFGNTMENGVASCGALVAVSQDGVLCCAD